MNNIEITNMSFDDFSEIEPIYNSEFDDFWKSSNLKSELENINSQCIVAKINDKIVGFACIWFSVDDVHITNIVTHKNFRHQGIASLLLEKLIYLAKNKASITLEVSTKNIYAKELYLKYGFKNLGIRKNYYKGIDDAYIMTLYLK